MVEERYETDVPDDVKLICDGYAAGINKFLLDFPDKKKKSFKQIGRASCRERV